jgi:peroxiredoxin
MRPKMNRAKSPAFALVLALACVGGCRSPSPPAPEPLERESPASKPAAEQAPEGPSAAAELGKPAPDFALPDLDGKQVRLSELRGRVVVLEWFNPECPFVKKSHTKGSLVAAADAPIKQGVVWLAINSGAPGKQGHGVEKNREGVATFGMKYPVLLDETGATGKSYGAEHTPHMFVIDPNGVLVYRGGIDNSPDAEGESPSGDKLIRYVDVALADLAAGKPVTTPETDAYGCSVKYSN